MACIGIGIGITEELLPSYGTIFGSVELMIQSTPERLITTMGMG